MRTLALALLLGCGGSTKPPPPSEPTPELTDVDDRCPTLTCVDGFDDGCPEARLEIWFSRDSDAVPSNAYPLLAAIAHDASKLHAGAQIVLGGEASPGEPPGLAMRRVLAVVSALRAHGVAADRLVPGLAPVEDGERHTPDRRVVIDCATP